MKPFYITVLVVNVRKLWHKLFGCKYRGAPTVQLVGDNYFIISHKCIFCSEEFRTWNTRQELREGEKWTR